MSSLGMLDDRILVRRIDRGEAVTKGGIHVPEQARELGDCAEIISVGKGKRNGDGRDPMELTPGQTIIINRYAGTEVKVDGEDCLILRDPDVLATVT